MPLQARLCWIVSVGLPMLAATASHLTTKLLVQPTLDLILTPGK